MRRSGYAGNERISLIGKGDGEAIAIRRRIQDEGLEVRHPGCPITLHVKRSPLPRKWWYFAHDPAEESNCKGRRVSQAHLDLQEHLVNLLRENGYEADGEVPIGSGRADVLVEDLEADVLVEGPGVTWVIEVQLSYQSLERTVERSVAFGANVLWLFEKRPRGCIDGPASLHAQLSPDHNSIRAPAGDGLQPLDDFVLRVVKGAGKSVDTIELEEWVAVDTDVAPVEHKHAFEVLRHEPAREARPKCRSLVAPGPWQDAFESGWLESGARDPMFWRALIAHGGRHPKFLRPMALCYAVAKNRRWTLQGERVVYEEPANPDFEGMAHPAEAFEEHLRQLRRLRSEWPAETGWCCPECDVPMSSRAAPPAWNKAVPFSFAAPTGRHASTAVRHFCGLYGNLCGLA